MGKKNYLVGDTTAKRGRKNPPLIKQSIKSSYCVTQWTNLRQWVWLNKQRCARKGLPEVWPNRPLRTRRYSAIEYWPVFNRFQLADTYRVFECIGKFYSCSIIAKTILCTTCVRNKKGKNIHFIPQKELAVKLGNKPILKHEQLD